MSWHIVYLLGPLCTWASESLKYCILSCPVVLCSTKWTYRAFSIVISINSYPGMVQANKPKQRSTINYHLQRLYKTMRYSGRA